MRVCALILILLALCPAGLAEELKPGEVKELRMSLRDTFVVQGSDAWTVDVNRVLLLRFAEVYITPKQGSDWSLALRFLCDTPDLGRSDTPEKMRQRVEESARPKTPLALEKQPEIKRLDVGGRYGYFTTLTDAALSLQKDLQPGQFHYLTEGMLRLSDDSAVSFVIYYNEQGSPGYTRAMDYVKSFVKPMPGASTQP